MAKIKLHINDQVQVLAGKDRGKKGKVMQVLRADNLVVVEGVNTMYKYIKAQRKSDNGQRVEFFGPIHVSNVKLLEAAVRETKSAVAPDKKA